MRRVADVNRAHRAIGFAVHAGNRCHRGRVRVTVEGHVVRRDIDRRVDPVDMVMHRAAVTQIVRPAVKAPRIARVVPGVGVGGASEGKGTHAGRSRRSGGRVRRAVVVHAVACHHGMGADLIDMVVHRTAVTQVVRATIKAPGVGRVVARVGVGSPGLASLTPLSGGGRSPSRVLFFVILSPRYDFSG